MPDPAGSGAAAAWPWTTWAHVAFAGAACWLLVPLGVGLARIRAPLHGTVQTAAAVAVFVSLVFASLGTTAAAGGTGGAVTMHAVAGLMLASGLVMQLTLGHVLHRHAGHHRIGGGGAEDERGGMYGCGLAGTVHRVLGLVLAGGLVFVEPALGVGELFALCDAPRERQCLGHFGFAGALLAGSAACYAVSLHWRAVSSLHVTTNGVGGHASVPRHRHYALFAAENGLAAGTALCAAAFCAFSEWPYTTAAAKRQAAASLLALAAAAAALWQLRSLHAARLPVPVYLQRGLHLCAATAAVGATLYLADGGNHNNQRGREYARATHDLTASLLLLASVARAAWLWRGVSLLLCLAGVTFVSAQAGFRDMYVAAADGDGAGISLATVLMADVCIGAAAFAAMHGWVYAYGKTRNQQAVVNATLGGGGGSETATAALVLC